jgi:hypothetical protein
MGFDTFHIRTGQNKGISGKLPETCQAGLYCMRGVANSHSYYGGMTFDEAQDDSHNKLGTQSAQELTSALTSIFKN